MSQTVQTHAQARAIIHRFESAHQKAVEEDVDIARVGWINFSERMLGPFERKDILRHLAVYALNDACLLIKCIQDALPADMPVDERRQLLHAHADHIAGMPAAMTDTGKTAFFDTMQPQYARYYPTQALGESSLLSWGGFDFDIYTSKHTGCPALRVGPSEDFPLPTIDQSGGQTPENFLYQFFHLAIDVALNDPSFPPPPSV